MTYPNNPFYIDNHSTVFVLDCKVPTSYLHTGQNGRLKEKVITVTTTLNQGLY